jgi:hemerythrin
MARPAARTAASPTPKNAAPHRRAARTRIDDEHRQLGELLASLVHTHDLHRVEKLLADLHTLLVRHFEGEEGAQGLHSVVGEGASHRLPNLQHLFDDHREFLSRLDALQAATAAALAGPVKEIAEGIHHLAESLRRHEAEEERLFSEAFYTDLGGRSS